MDKGFLKLFGINRTNFYGWLLTGLLLMGACLWTFLLAVRSPDAQTRIELLLISIFLVMLGIFGTVLSMYCALLPEKLEREERERAVLRPEKSAEGSTSFRV